VQHTITCSAYCVLHSCHAITVCHGVVLLQLQVGAVFARHNLLDDFDSWSDIPVWHKFTC
jgi:hypothetical protein